MDALYQMIVYGCLLLSPLNEAEETGKLYVPQTSYLRFKASKKCLSILQTICTIQNKFNQQPKKVFL